MSLVAIETQIATAVVEEGSMGYPVKKTQRDLPWEKLAESVKNHYQCFHKVVG